jgi:hypothetical protein
MNTRTVVACVLLGTVVGAVMGWASGPESPGLEVRMWLAGGGLPAQRAVNRYMDALAQFIIAGMLIGSVLGGAVGVARILLTGAGRQT